MDDTQNERTPNAEKQAALDAATAEQRQEEGGKGLPSDLDLDGGAEGTAEDGTAEDGAEVEPEGGEPEPDEEQEPDEPEVEEAVEPEAVEVNLKGVPLGQNLGQDNPNF